MPDEPELPLAGLDAERPLPPELRARLEAALLAAVAGGLPVRADVGGLHQPPGTHTGGLHQPPGTHTGGLHQPPGTHTGGLHQPPGTHTGGLHQPPGTHTDALDAPRPLPEALRARLESALLAEAPATATATTPPAEAPSATPPAAAAATPIPPAAAVADRSSTATGGAQGPSRASSATGGAQDPGAGNASSAGAITSTTQTAGGAQPPTQTAGGAQPPTQTAGGAVVPLEGRRRKVVAWWSAVAAVLVLTLAMAGVTGIGRQGGSGKVQVANPPTTAETPASLPSDAGVPVEATSPTSGPTVPSGPASTATTRGKPVKPSPTTGPLAPSSPLTSTPTNPAPTSAQPGGGSTQPAPTEGDRGPAPPFYDSTGGSGDAANPPAMSSDPAAASPSGSSGQQGAAPSNQTQRSNTPTPAPTGPALRVGIVPGDAAQEAGFRAYVNRLNQGGGVAGHAIELVTVGPGSPAADTIATVNLGTQPVAGPGGAPSWATGPLLETLTATESLLPGHGAVFSFASPPERQGHLAADALFPTKAPAGTRAVIYVPVAAGPLRDVVPEAIKAVLKERGVVSVDIVTYEPPLSTATPSQSEARKRLARADASAAFVSLDPAAAKAWAADAKAADFRPAAGVAGIYSLADDALLADLPEGARVVSPYLVPGGAEGQAIRSDGGGTSASVLHGWATAKSLAAAIWRTGADTPAELQTALEGLAGWSSGLTPPYETRPDTRSRTPEGVLFQVQSAAFTPQGGFRRDPRPQPI